MSQRLSFFSSVPPQGFSLLNVYKQKKEEHSFFLFSTPSGARTLDPNIKSVVLYQLS